LKLVAAVHSGRLIQHSPDFRIIKRRLLANRLIWAAVGFEKIKEEDQGVEAKRAGKEEKDNGR
jgi:hypothetical protein